MKPEVVDARIARSISHDIVNVRELLCYSRQALVNEIATDTSKTPLAPDWKRINESVTKQLVETFALKVQVRLIDTQTQEELNETAGMQEAEQVTIDILREDVVLPSLALHG